MYNSKLFTILKSLNNLEFNEFGRYLKTPFLNRKKDVIALYNYIDKFYPSLSHPNLEKNKIAQKLFGGSINAVGKKIYNVTHDMVKLLEDYLVWKALQEESYEKKQILFYAQEKRQLRELSLQTLTSMKKDLTSDQIEDEFKYLKLFELDYNFYKNRSSNNIKKDNTDLLFFETLDLFYSILKLRQGVEYLNRKNIYGGESDFFIGEQIKTIAQFRGFEENILIQMYTLIYETLERGINTATLPNYFKLKQLFLSNLDSLSQAHQLYILTYLQNYAIKALNSGLNELTGEIFSWAKLGIDRKIVFQNGGLLPIYLFNAIQSGCAHQKYQEAEDLLINNTQYLVTSEKENKKNMSKFCWAYLYSEKGNYDKVHQLLQNVELDNVYYNLVSRFLIAKSFYEQKEYKALKHYLLAFKAYINRNKELPAERKKSYLELVRFIHQLMRIRQKDQKYSPIELMKILDKEHRIPFRSWLKVKVRSIMECQE